MNLQDTVNDILLVMSQKELSEKVGVSQTTISFLSNGLRRDTASRNAQKIFEIHFQEKHQISSIKKA